MGKKPYMAFPDDDAWRSLRDWVAEHPEADPESLRKALAELGRPPSWREFAAALELLGMRAPGGAPPFLAEFVGRLAAARGAERVLDPFAMSPTMIAALAEFLPDGAATALAPGAWVERAGRSFAPSVDWRVGAPYESLGSLDGQFDLIAATPPLNVRGGRFPVRRGLGEYANSLMVDASGLVAPTGALVFLISDGFFFRADAERTRAALAKVGLRVEAAISVEGGLRPSSEVPTSLLVITHGEPLDRLFIGRLDPAIDPGVLIENMAHRRAGEFLQLGYLYPMEHYRGWRALLKEHELLVGLGKSRAPFVNIDNIAIAYTRLPAEDNDDEGNSVYVPEFPRAEVLISPPAKPRGYIRIDLDPGRASARWVAKWLNEPLGRTARSAFATGSVIERVRLQDLSRLLIVLPPLEDQIKAIDVGQELQLIAGEVADVQSGLYTGRLLVGESQSFLDRVRGAFADDENAVSVPPTAEDWIERLPFPLASIGRRYLTVQTPRDKLDHLQHFFEAYGIFIATLLLSAVRRDAPTYEVVRAKLARAGRGRSIFDRTDFGTWIELGRTLAKRVRARLNDDGAGDIHAALFGNVPTEFTDTLVAGDYFDVLDTARTIRNRRSHGGIESEGPWLEAQLAALQAALNELRLKAPHPFTQVHLLQPQGAEQGDDDVFTFGQAQCLMGSHPVFSQRVVQSIVPMRARGLYLVPTSDLVELPLQLLPLIQMLPVTGTDEQAAYYYNRLSPDEDDDFRFVTYHFAGQPEEHLTNPELANLIADFTPSDRS